ncbi:MAG: haloacid dehalogenase-like hydrolase [Oscillospiraceae bacterium]|nr:haloacid dehalogenase-like hydrolase [Oscillospiraceae bacterium]
MNVYDFDGTIYAGDSTADFTLYCIRKQARVLRALPRWVRAAVQAASGYLTNRGAWNKTGCKEQFYSYLPMVKDMPGTLDRFWAGHERKIYKWYKDVKRPDDVIISAGPRFLLEPICARMGVTLIASEVDPATGKCGGRNCHGETKVARFKERYPHAEVEAFYSDSTSDLPMARLAQRAYRVRHGRVAEWRGASAPS